jgi:hypothetical protein
VLVFVGAAVLLNWSYNNRWGEPDAEMVLAEDQGIAEAQAKQKDDMEYFSEARLTRQVSRDEALELPQSAASAETRRRTARPIWRPTSKSACSTIRRLKTPPAA